MGSKSFNNLITHPYSRIGATLVLLSFICSCFQASSARQTSGKLLDSPIHGPKLRNCKDNWPDISAKEDATQITECMRTLMTAAAPLMTRPEGIPELGIPQIDPLIVQNSIDFGSDIFSGKIWNISMEGTSGAWKKSDTWSISYNPERKEVQVVVISPNPMSISSDYRMVIDAGSMFGMHDSPKTITEGHFDGTADSLKATVVLSLKKGKNGLHVTSGRGDFELGTMNVNFQGEDPNDPLTNLMNTVMKSDDASREIMKELKPQISGIFVRIIGALFHKGWKMLDRL